MTLEAPGHVTRRFVVRLPVDPLEVQLQRGPAVLQGDVVGPDGAPVAGAGVRVEWSRPPAPATPVARGEVQELEPSAGRQFGGTDAQGRFRVEGLPAGATFRVGASATSFDRVTRDGVGAGERVRLVLTPQRPRWPTHVQFRAVAAESGSPIHGRVFMRARWAAGEEGSSVVSNSSDGQGVSFGEHVGKLTLQFEAPLRVPSRPVEVNVVPGAPPVLLGDVPLLLGGAVELTIDGWPALPVTALRARWRDPDGRERVATPSAPAATWTIDGIAAGATELEVEAVVSDREPIRRSFAVHVRAGETTAARVHLGGGE